MKITYDSQKINVKQVIIVIAKFFEDCHIIIDTNYQKKY